jgi:hypothetical protein
MAMRPIGNTKEAGSLARNPQIEQFLIERRVTFDLIERVSIANIDVESSLHNQARLGNPLNDENVRKIREAIRKGTKTPPILAKRKANGQYLVLDGNHRVAAHQAEELPIDLYECSGRDETLTLIMYEANTLHGLPTSEVDRTAAAMFLVDQGFGIKESADRMLVPVAAVRREVAKIESDRRAAKVQIDPRVWGKLSDSVRAKLPQLRTDETFLAATQLVVDSGMKSDAVTKLVTEINRETSVAGQLDIIAAMREELSDNIAGEVVEGGTGKKGMRSPKARVNMITGQFKSLGDPGAIAAAIPVPERDAMVEKIKSAQEWLYKFEEALGG